MGHKTHLQRMGCGGTSLPEGTESTGTREMSQASNEDTQHTGLMSADTGAGVWDWLCCATDDEEGRTLYSKAVLPPEEDEEGESCCRLCSCCRREDDSEQ